MVTCYGSSAVNGCTAHAFFFVQFESVFSLKRKTKMEVISILGENSIMKTSNKSKSKRSLIIPVGWLITNYKSFLNLFKRVCLKHDKFFERGYSIYGKKI